MSSELSDGAGLSHCYRFTGMVNEVADHYLGAYPPYPHSPGPRPSRRLWGSLLVAALKLSRPPKVLLQTSRETT